MLIYSLASLLIAVIVHEVAHGYASLYLGDPTAKRLGRLSLNPLVHIDPVGSVLVPALLVYSGAPFFIAWAKPVPVQPRYFQSPYRDMMWVALAGPISNIFLMCIAILVTKFIFILGFPATPFIVSILKFCQASIVINLVLAVFNMIPIPPLDGSRVLANFLPQSLRLTVSRLEPYGMILLILFLMTDALSWLLAWIVPPVLEWLY